MVRWYCCVAGIVVGGVLSLSAQQGATPITLNEAITRAVARHPALAAARLETDARTAEAVQASRRPNPTVSAELEDLGRTAGSSMPSQTTVSVAQRFELGGKRALRTSLAELERDLAHWDLAIARSELEGRVAQSFLLVLAADAELMLARADAETAREVAAAVEARVTAGVTAPPELDRAQASAAAARVAMLRVEETRRAAAIALTSAWGPVPVREIALAGALDAPIVIPDQAELDEALARAPALARWTTEQARREKAVASVRAARVPDVDLGAGYRRLHDVESHAWVLGATVSWPLFDRQKDQMTAAQLRRDAAGHERAAAAAGVRAAVESARNAAIGAQATLVELDQRVIPLSERASTAVLEGYQAGRFSLLDVLDARRGLADARKERLRTRADLYRALITIFTVLGDVPARTASFFQGVRQ